MSFETRISEKEGIVLLRDNSTGTEAEVFLFGALLNAFRIPVSGSLTNVVAGFTDPQQAYNSITDGFRSAKLSPFVCRLRKGTYSFEGTDYHITGHFLNGHAIHGLLFNATYAVAATVANEAQAAVTLSFDYRGTDKGYPFPFQIHVEWALGKGNTLHVTTSILHRNSHAIPYTDGWHPYFTLGESIDNCRLQFDSKTQFAFDQELLPNGTMVQDERFKKGTLMKGIELDNAFQLEGDAPACRLNNDSLALTITPDKSYPVLQLYTPPDRKSIAIENLSGPPDNFNNHMQLLLLTPGETRSFSTSYRVDVL